LGPFVSYVENDFLKYGSRLLSSCNIRQHNFAVDKHASLFCATNYANFITLPPEGKGTNRQSKKFTPTTDINKSKQDFYSILLEPKVTLLTSVLDLRSIIKWDLNSNIDSYDFGHTLFCYLGQT